MCSKHVFIMYSTYTCTVWVCYTLYTYTHLVSSSTFQQDGVTIHHRDLRRLVPDVYLNDSLIDFRIKHVFLNLVEEKKAKVHVFSSLFYTKVRDLFILHVYACVLYTGCIFLYYILFNVTYLYMYIGHNSDYPSYTHNTVNRKEDKWQVILRQCTYLD